MPVSCRRSLWMISRKLLSPRSPFTRIRIALLFVICAGIYFYSQVLQMHVRPKYEDQIQALFTINHTITTELDSDSAMAESIRLSMLHSWKAYRRYAWGKDETEPIHKRYSEWMGAALTMIDALDTLWLMGLTNEFNEARNWIDKNLRFNKDNDHISLFETTIRILGGLLSAFNLSGDEVFLRKAQELGPLLMVAFGPASVLPKPDINFAKRTASFPSWSNRLSLSEVSSIQLEFNHLTLLTKDNRYAVAGAKVFKHLHSVPKLDGLMRIELDSTGAPIPTSRITLGARGDSYYEYLLKVWIQTGKQINYIKEDYLNAIDGIQRQLVRYSKPNNLLYIGELEGDNSFSSKMDHLVCFLPGTLVLGYINGMPETHLKLAEQLAQTCFEMYNQTKTNLSPEIVQFSTQPEAKTDFVIKVGDGHNLLRPEALESFFYLYRLTKDSKYQQWGKVIFTAFLKYSRIPSAGFAGIRDVTNTLSPRLDKMNSYWLSETLKYSFLLLNETAASLYPLDKWIFNTEGHLLRINENSENPLSSLYLDVYL